MGVVLKVVEYGPFDAGVWWSFKNQERERGKKRMRAGNVMINEVGEALFYIKE